MNQQAALAAVAGTLIVLRRLASAQMERPSMTPRSSASAQAGRAMMALCAPALKSLPKMSTVFAHAQVMRHWTATPARALPTGPTLLVPAVYAKESRSSMLQPTPANALLLHLTMVMVSAHVLTAHCLTLGQALALKVRVWAPRQSKLSCSFALMRKMSEKLRRKSCQDRLIQLDSTHSCVHCMIVVIRQDLHYPLWHIGGVK
jgi:hypothetical protein